MKTFIQNGNTVTLTAPYDVLSGEGVLIGSIFGIASNNAASDTEVELVLEGVFSISKVKTQSWTAGTPVYWDNTDQVVTTTATNNKLIGVAITPASNPSTSGLVRLNGAFVS